MWVDKITETEERLGEPYALAVAFGEFADVFVTLGGEAHKLYELIYHLVIYHLVIGHFCHEGEVLGDVHVFVEGVVLREVTDTRGGGDGA